MNFPASSLVLTAGKENSMSIIRNLEEKSSIVEAQPNELVNPASSRLRSLVWNDFSKVQKPDGTWVAECHNCNKHFVASSRSGTTHLRNHLNICVPGRQIPRQPAQRGRKRKPLKLVTDIRKYCKARRNEAPDEDDHPFDQESCREDLARMIILHGYPLSIVNTPGFRAFVRSLQPQFQIMPYEVVKSDCMKIYEIERLKLHEALGKLTCRVSFTLNMWRASVDTKYMILTCYYIDDDWKLEAKILCVFPVNDFSTDEVISDIIIGTLCNWEINKKLFSLVLQNDGCADSVSKRLQEFFHSKDSISMSADLFHVLDYSSILNHIVGDGLEQISELVSRVRETVKYVKSSREIIGRFQLAAKQVQAPQKQLFLDSPANWHSTYSMLAVFCQFKDVFQCMAGNDHECQPLLSSSEWDNVEAIVHCLNQFYQAIERLANTTTPTANLSFNHLWDIRALMEKWSTSQSPILVSMAERMIKAFESCWESCSKIMSISCILDPRYKFKSVEYYFRNIYGDNYEAQMKIENIRKALTNSYNEYSQSVSCFAGSNDRCDINEYGSDEVPRSSSQTILSDTRKGLDKYLQESSNQSVKTDLDLYLEEPVQLKDSLSDNFDILSWWKFNAAKFPLLSLMARDILAIPLSVVGSLACVNLSKENLGSLDPPTIEGFICAQDWLRNECRGDISFISTAAEANGCLSLVPANEDG